VVAVGIDGCRVGWIAVALLETKVGVYHLPTIAALTDVVATPTAVGIDIPIGLPDAGRRPADVEARLMLGPRRHSVFFAPVRAAVEATTHRAATELSVRITGSGISRQAHNLARKILEVEQWLPDAPCGVWEVHPELSFALLMGKPARASKKTWAGMIERRNALTSVGISLDGAPYEAGVHAAVDDVLDAGAVAWSATRLLAGTARSFPDPPPSGVGGRSIAIWA
jgi:predicted RNase H-like nuclease